MGRPHLDARLAEVDAPGQLLAHEGVGVVRALEHALQRLQLAAVERGAVPPLLLLPLGGTTTPRTGALTCGEGTRGSVGQRLGCGGCPRCSQTGQAAPAPRGAGKGREASACSAVCTELSPWVSLHRGMAQPQEQERLPLIHSFVHPSILPSIYSFFNTHALSTSCGEGSVPGPRGI